MAGLSDWARAANPLAPARTREEAVRSARVGALALVLMAALSLITIPLMLEAGERMLDLVKEQMATSITEAEEDPAATAVMNQMFDAIPAVMVGTTIFFALVGLVLAAVQWWKPNPIIPALVLALTVIGLLNMVATLLFNPALAPFMPEPWQLAYSVASQLVFAVLLAAAFRGGLAMGKFPQQA